MWSATAEKVLKIGRFWCHFGRFISPPPQPSWQTASSNGDLEVGFWIEKIENFEIFWDRPKSIGDGFGKCLGWFWRDFGHLAAVWECVAVVGGGFRGLGTPGGRLWRPLEVGWRSDFGSKKSKILDFSGIAPNRLGMRLGSVWGCFGAILSLCCSFGSVWRCCRFAKSDWLRYGMWGQ